MGTETRTEESQKFECCNLAFSIDNDPSAAKSFRCEDSSKLSISPLVLSNHEKATVLSNNFDHLWALESIGIRDDPWENDDETATKCFNDTVKVKDERYHVRFPFKETNPELPDNRQLSLSRLRSTWKRHHNKSSHRQAADTIVKEQEKLDIIEEINPDDMAGPIVHYIPHQLVAKEDNSTTKIRMVFDASARTKHGQDLNSCLYRGPVLLKNLVGILGDLRRALGVLKIEDFSSLWRLQGIIRTVIHAANKLLKRSTTSVNESQRALNILIQFVQNEAFDREFKLLRSNRTNEMINKLRLFIDDKGIMRAQGRFEKADLPFTQRSPILLPSKHHLTKLIVEDIHKRNMHAGVDGTMAKALERFWITSPRRTI